MSRRLFQDAIEAYRRGHDRVWENARMRPLPSPELPHELEFSQPSESPRLGIPVARELDFHRGPDTWRARDTPGGQRAGDD